MDQLQNARERISEIDLQMAELFRRRMEAVGQVAEYKREHGLPVLDAGRESALLAANSRRIDDPVLREFYVLFLQNNMAVSRAYQHRLLQGMRVAYSGTEGAFAHIAAGRLFPGAELVGCHDFQAAYQAAATGQCDCAVLPLENSYAGEVGQVTDLMFSGSLVVNGVYELGVKHHLVGLPQATLADVRRAVSHPQALQQCAGYLRSHGISGQEMGNTAAAAQMVAQQSDPALAAIASADTARLYGLKILGADINASPSNTTRFAVFSRTEYPNQGGRMDDHFILLFTVRNQAGALAQAMNVIGRNGFNLRTLRSRPMKELLWEYYFYVEAEGDIRSPAGQTMLRQLANCCDRVKAAGSFHAHCRIDEEEEDA